jgi:hypothetical protein
VQMTQWVIPAPSGQHDVLSKAGPFWIGDCVHANRHPRCSQVPKCIGDCVVGVNFFVWAGN